MNVLAALKVSTGPHVMVTVASTRGSTPRKAGTWMLVGETAFEGTIGGGTLELRAIEQARRLLSGDEPVLRQWSERLTLGAKLGQCCGGEATLLFEQVPSSEVIWGRLLEAPNLVSVTDFCDPPKRWYFSSTLELSQENTLPRALVDTVDATLRGLGESAMLLDIDVQGQTQRYLVHHWTPPQPTVAVFGAGHVGLALVDVLQHTPFRIQLIDDRQDRIPQESGANVEVLYARSPEAHVEHLPPRSAALVMTYSHALDRKICSRLLARDDLSYVGLIGSASKRKSFENHWRKRGMDEATMERLVCPIGIDGLPGKEPGVIAIGVAAQLIAQLHPEAEDS